MTFWKNFLRDEEGQDYVEYAVLIGGIGLLVLGAAQALGNAISNQYNDIGTAVGNLPE